MDLATSNVKVVSSPDAFRRAPHAEAILKVSHRPTRSPDRRKKSRNIPLCVTFSAPPVAAAAPKKQRQNKKKKSSVLHARYIDCLSAAASGEVTQADRLRSASKTDMLLGGGRQAGEDIYRVRDVGKEEEAGRKKQ